jgi:hypothetical protein
VLFAGLRTKRDVTSGGSKRFFFSAPKASRFVPRATQFVLRATQFLSRPGVKRPGREPDDATLSNVDGRNEYS